MFESLTFLNSLALQMSCLLAQASLKGPLKGPTFPQATPPTRNIQTNTLPLHSSFAITSNTPVLRPGSGAVKPHPFTTTLWKMLFMILIVMVECNSGNNNLQLQTVPSLGHPNVSDPDGTLSVNETPDANGAHAFIFLSVTTANNSSQTTYNNKS